MAFFKKLREIFSDRQGEAEKRVAAKIAQGCDWSAVEDDIFPKKGPGPRVSSVLASITAAKNWKLLTPLAERTGEWLGVVDLAYRPGESGPVPAGRAQECEEIYQALRAAPRHGKKLAETFVTCIENMACARNAEDCYDWARGKPEFGPVGPIGLASLADHPIEGNPLAMKVLASKADIDRAVDAAEWVYNGKAADLDTALDNLETWRKKLDAAEKKQAPPAPPPFRP